MKSSFFSTTILLSTAVGIAQSAPPEPPLIELDPLTVTSSPLNPGVAEVTQTWSVRDGSALENQRSSTIGETLAFEPGVATTYYGTNASRPIIRGLDGTRVRVLQNGQDAFDVSAASVDHAVAIDPMLVERVEILRGSSALLYGATATGGVVNLIDRSIPTTLPEGGIAGQLRAVSTSGNDGWETGALGMGSVGDFAFQVHSTFRETKDYDTPGFVLPDGHHVDSVDNSHSETWTAGLGGAYLFDQGHVGLAYAYYESAYGVPNEEAPTIDLERSRLTAQTALVPEGVDWLKQIEFQLAYGDYTHQEIEQNGFVAATFLREGLESRLSLVHQIGDLEGVLGWQVNFDETRISGEENVLAGGSGVNPAITQDESQRWAVFLLETYSLSPQITLNGGVRLEGFYRDLEGAEDRDDHSISASGGAVLRPTDNWALSGSLNYTERLPETTELYSDGPHLATGGYELGDPTLGKESAWGLELILRRTAGPVTGHLAMFYTYINDYIYLEDTGNVVEFEHAHGEDADHHHDEDDHHDEGDDHHHDDADHHHDEGDADHHHEDDADHHHDEDDHGHAGETLLAERAYRSADAEFYGFEAEVAWRILAEGDWQVELRGFGDALWARNIDADTDLPRISPWRLGTSIMVDYQGFSWQGDLIYTAEQSRTAPGEGSTDGYTLLNTRLGYTWETTQGSVELFLRGRNLTDELAFVHTSFLRDSAPLPGRSFDLGLRVTF